MPSNPAGQTFHQPDRIRLAGISRICRFRSGCSALMSPCCGNGRQNCHLRPDSLDAVRNRDPESEMQDAVLSLRLVPRGPEMWWQT